MNLVLKLVLVFMMFFSLLLVESHTTKPDEYKVMVLTNNNYEPLEIFQPNGVVTKVKLIYKDKETEKKAYITYDNITEPKYIDNTYGRIILPRKER